MLLLDKVGKWAMQFCLQQTDTYFHEKQISSLNNIHIAYDFDPLTISKIYT